MKELTPLLEKLAAKFGTTVEMLWDVLLKQAVISATMDLIFCVGIVLGLGWCFRFVQRKTTPVPDTDSRYSYSDWGGEGKGVAWLVMAVMAVIGAILIIAGVQNAVTGYMNPQYWALEHILKSCK